MRLYTYYYFYKGLRLYIYYLSHSSSNASGGKQREPTPTINDCKPRYVSVAVPGECRVLYIVHDSRFAGQEDFTCLRRKKRAAPRGPAQLGQSTNKKLIYICGILIR